MASFITAGNATNGLQVSSDNTGILELRTGTGSGTTAVTFSTGQRATFPSTISVGNTTPATTGAGITFPAAQSASSDANTLDDYEEGTWNATFSSGFTSPVYSNQAGSYTKIGRFVYVTARLTVSGGTRNGSILTIGNLPFTSRNASAPTGAGTFSYVTSSVINSTTTNLPILYIGTNTTDMQFYKTEGNSFNGTDLNAATPDIYFTACYITD